MKADRKTMNRHEKVNILMVDDQPAKLLTYEVMLADLGEHLIKANSGREALEHLLKTEVAVVLMDVSMPELDGFELAEIIRQHPRFQRIAIIFVSAVHMTDGDRLKGYQRGAVDYIAVPVVPELLRAKVSIFAELHRKTKQMEALNSELHQLSNRLIAVQDEERRRIARDLHDGLGQELAAAKMMIDGVLMQDSLHSKDETASEAGEIIDRAIQQIRTLSHLLHPPLLDEVGLLSALRWYMDGFTERSQIKTFLDVQPPEFPRLRLDVETAVFRIVQEALTNVFRHSGARSGWVSLVQKEGWVEIAIRDNGKGVDEHLGTVRSARIGVGIGGMRGRAKELGGEFRVTNANPGTLVEVVIPCARPVSHEAEARA
jgi:signal transduction histidine kinase